jgi:hypothetical protein
VALVTLDAVKPATVYRHDRALHVNQIILAQLLSFPIKDCAIRPACLANSSVEIADGFFDALGDCRIIITFQ